MCNTSRGLRETVIRALAKVGLVWALAVLGALFMAMASHGNESDGGYSLEAVGSAPPTTSFSVESAQAPRTAGLALALLVLAGGVTILAAGAVRERGVSSGLPHAADSTMDLPLALGLCFSGADPA